jgi:hypothetical protein
MGDTPPGTAGFQPAPAGRLEAGGPGAPLQRNPPDPALARAVGPAIAGLLIARAGVGAVFALNTATLLLYGLVVAAWRPPAGAPPPLREQFVSALRAGGQYVRYAHVVRRLLRRTALFLVPASALWALLPVVASQRLGQGAGGYGLLLGALGVGAIVGAVLLP